jgi:hypothetical protein
MNVKELYLNTYPLFQLKYTKYLITEHESPLQIFQNSTLKYVSL